MAVVVAYQPNFGEHSRFRKVFRGAFPLFYEFRLVVTCNPNKQAF